MDADTEERPAKKTRMYDSDQDGAPTPAPPRLPSEVVSTPAISTSALRSVLKGAVFACVCRSSLVLSTCCKTDVKRWCTVFVVQAVPNYAQPWCACLLSTCWFGGIVCRARPFVAETRSCHSEAIDVVKCTAHKMLHVLQYAACLCRQMRPQRSTSGSAFIIDADNRWIMTNAHVVRLWTCNAA